MKPLLQTFPCCLLLLNSVIEIFVLFASQERQTYSQISCYLQTLQQNPWLFQILIRTLAFGHCIHRAYTLTPASSPLQSSLIFLSWQREHKCKRVDGKRYFTEKRYPRDPRCLSFPLPFFSSSNLLHFPSKTCLVYNLCKQLQYLAHNDGSDGIVGGHCLPQW